METPLFQVGTVDGDYSQREGESEGERERSCLTFSSILGYNRSKIQSLKTLFKFFFMLHERLEDATVERETTTLNDSKQQTNSNKSHCRAVHAMPIN